MNDLYYDEALDLIEDLGLFLEKSGYIPSAARVYALLLVWDVEALHFDEIMSILKLSKGATSKAVNALESMNRIKVFTKTGIRKKLYRVKVKPGKESAQKFLIYLKMMKEKLEKIQTFKEKGGLGGQELGDEIEFFDQLIEVFLQTL